MAKRENPLQQNTEKRGGADIPGAMPDNKKRPPAAQSGDRGFCLHAMALLPAFCLI